MRDHEIRMDASHRYRPPIRRRRIQFNQALKLTRLSACLLGGPAFGEDRGMRRLCTPSAVQLNAGVGPLVVVAGGRLGS
jgi:hypothetical protein